MVLFFFFFFQAEDGIRDKLVTGVQTCALPICVAVTGRTIGLDQLEAYRAAGDGDAPPPRLHRLGATTWQRQRDKTRTAIRKMAADLLDLYARRQLASGFAFPPDTAWQRELESAVLYEGTPDQRRATEEVKRDLERARPMDRLLVGDVGY